ncbi:FAS1-like dehydratase domain-containing protein [Caenimonas aquaedulcis]|uniref:MaoC family dehydratase N-terminal domain-containing protein n=1 Tax=Caenimonas aquaedulcis TaxID=2793270 RepID=A0A931H3T1_9BURK|nr:MaoC family dehydratase N-terminal domain-containing protein [Caenimonas aquaedulcis]MBG9387960.1 MaoC family dehydratase N-terminal domain-containing protein [Caenimonas aquaedulcis]
MDTISGNPRITDDDVAQLRSWEGRSETVADSITGAPVHALAATLDHASAAADPGAELPPLWHWLYFLPRARQSELGEDGHPRLGGFLPPVPLPRRMWAGGRLQWRAPLRVGHRAERTSRIASVTHKAGRTGDLVFVVVRHDIASAGGLALTEEHDIVYRAPPQPGDAPPPPQAAPADAVWNREIVPDPVLLFRYSALTFNGHRIHYDRSYVTQVEGYPGLIVHGPLIATLLMDLATRERPGARVAGFSFKAIRPTFDLHPFRVCGRPSADGRSADLWAQDHEGWLTMQARIEFA